jgi:hypothetical protein
VTSHQSAIRASIDVTDRTVTWAAFTQPRRPTRDRTGLGPLRSDRRKYGTALTGLRHELASLKQ